MNHIVSIHGRAAVPLRLLPFASHWLDLNTIARGLAQPNDEPTIFLKAYCLDGAKVIPIPCHQWDSLAYQMEQIAQVGGAHIDDRYQIAPNDVLPAGMFLWLDELQRAHDDVFLDAKSFLEKYGEDNSDGTSYIGLREGDELHLDCVLTTEQRRRVFEGFEPQREEAAPTDGEAEPAPPAGTAPDDEPILELERGVTRNVIIDAFRVFPKTATNIKFWDDKLSEPPVWLRAARTSSGKRGVSSRWNPLLVAHALLGRKHMTPRALDKVMRERFWNQFDEWLAQTSDADR